MVTVDLVRMFVELSGFKTRGCAARRCGRWLTVKRITERKIGVHMDQLWYCGVDCLREVSEERFAQLLSGANSPSTHAPRMPIGLLLVSRGLVSKEQLQRAGRDQQNTGMDVGEILVKQEVLTAKQLAGARAAQWDCPLFAAPKGAILNSVKIPRAILECHSMVPLHYAAATNSLLIGFVKNVDYESLYIIEQITGCKTCACFVTREDFCLQMEQQARISDDNPTLSELVFKGINTPSELARILCEYGLLFRADIAAIDICREHLWARLKNGSRAVDLVFRLA